MGNQSSKFTDSQFTIEKLEGVNFLSFDVENVWRKAAAPKSPVAAESQVPDYSVLYKVQGVDIFSFVDAMLKKRS